jgi:hypothetical protein
MAMHCNTRISNLSIIVHLFSRHFLPLLCVVKIPLSIINIKCRTQRLLQFATQVGALDQAEFLRHGGPC